MALIKSLPGLSRYRPVDSNWPLLPLTGPFGPASLHPGEVLRLEGPAPCVPSPWRGEGQGEGDGRLLSGTFRETGAGPYSTPSTMTMLASPAPSRLALAA